MILKPEAVPVAVLCGGLGTRLRPVLSDTPKALAEVGDRPFLTYLFDQVMYYGFRTIVLCTGHLGERIEDRFGDRYGALRLLHSRESAPLGTGGSLRLALPLLRSDVVLVMNGDSFCDVHLQQFLTRHAGSACLGSIVLTEVPDTSRFGRVYIDAGNRVVSFVEKEKDQAGVAGLVNAGIYLFNAPLLAMLRNIGPASLEKDLLPAWVNSGLYGHLARGVFTDIGTPETYGRAAQTLSGLGFLRHHDWLPGSGMDALDAVR